jgi:CelD/BcsL family acetyltransferase involved in cellulose biosynthesis
MTLIASEWISREHYQDALAELVISDTSAYHRLPWLDAVSIGFGAEIRFARSTGSDGETLALTPFMCKKKGSFRLVGTPLSGTYTQFTGPLLRDGLMPETIALVMAELHRLVAKSSSYIEWGCKGEQAWGAMLSPFGYQKTKRATLLINLSPGESAVWSSFEGRARNMVRKAEKAGVVARTVQPSQQWITSYYEMLGLTFMRQGLAVPHPLSFYKQMITLSNAGVAHCVAAEVDGKMIAGNIFLVDDKRMLYLSGVTNEQGMTLAATSLLQWHAIKEAIRLGVTEYDLGGLGIPSIDKFKRSFGGCDFAHSRWVYRSRLFGLAEPLALWAARKGWLRLNGE